MAGSAAGRNESPAATACLSAAFGKAIADAAGAIA
jgi:hypothetical protein